MMTSIGQIQPEARGQENLDESSKESQPRGHSKRTKGGYCTYVGTFVHYYL